jgi:hypothetical protein
MTGEKYEWAGAFTAIEAAMIGAANQRSAEFAVTEAERRGLIMRTEPIRIRFGKGQLMA